MISSLLEINTNWYPCIPLSFIDSDDAVHFNIRLPVDAILNTIKFNLYVAFVSNYSLPIKQSYRVVGMD